MTIVDVCNFLYPGQQDAGYIAFGKPEDRIIINSWTVPGIEKPTEDYLESLIPQYQRQFDIDMTDMIFNSIINTVLKETAEAKQYSGTLSLLSYLHSTNTEWASEASAFSQFRDSVYVYFYTLYDNIVSNPDFPIPDQETFINGLPIINWPS